jgi:hypothetical protein
LRPASLRRGFFQWNRFPAVFVVMPNEKRVGTDRSQSWPGSLSGANTPDIMSSPGFDSQSSPAVTGGRIFCPYCVAEHVWSSTEARLDDRERERRQKPLVRQAS